MRSFLAIGFVLLSVLVAFEPQAAPDQAAPQLTVTPSLVPSPTPNTLLPLNPTTQASVGDPYYSQLGNGGYDVQHYDLALDVDVAHNIISGTTTISAEATTNFNAFNLDLSGLAVTQVAVNNNAAAWSRVGQELTITPTIALADGQVFTSTIRYSGTPQPVISKAIALPMGWVHYDKGIYVAGEPEGAATWRPVNDHPLDKATYTIQITVRDPYVAVANGILQQTTHVGSSTTYRWITTHPLASYLVTVDIAQYVTQQAQGPGGLPIRNVFPVDIVPQAQVVFAPTADMIAYFSSIFGSYPFEAYGVVVVDHDLPFALETQTMSLFGRNVAAQDPTLSEDVVAHELAHQWFGDSVSLRTWQDIWLNESFATYATWLWNEHVHGLGTADRIAQTTYAQIASQNLSPTGLPPANDLFSTSVYERGALVLHALRLKIGDDAFFRTLQAYTARYRDGNASTPDFIAVAEQTSGQDLHAFFHQWLYQQTLPPLKGYRLFVPLF